MNSIKAFGVAAVVFGMAACAPSQAQRVDDKADRIASHERFAPSDPAFNREDPMAKIACKGDSDCPAGALCHPGQRMCFSAHPSPRMLEIVTVPGASRDGLCRAYTVYFAFDSIELVPEASRTLGHDANCIVARHDERVVLEAHADARGDKGYNVDLSRRRGEAVRTFLSANGVKATIEIISRGESDPAMSGTSERDYAYNRRVEIQLK